jgi:protease-4
MKVNPLISEIIRGQWLMQPQYLAGMGHIIAKMLAGEEVTFNATQTNLIKLYDGNANLIQGEYLTNGWGQIVKTEFEVPQGSYAMINMMGPVIKYGDMCTYGADEITDALNKVNSMANIKGIIMNIDGPGGAVSAIGPFLQFAKNKRKPVVGLVDMAASLHYWTAVALCDHIMVDNNVSSMVGSVGVVVSFADTKPYYEEKGIKFHEIYPPESKDKNLSFRLALEGKYDKLIDEHLSPIAQKFQAAVRAGRPNLKERDGVLSGRTFFADEALDNGMIDSIGDLRAAMKEVDRLAFKQAIKPMFN